MSGRHMRHGSAGLSKTACSVGHRRLNTASMVAANCAHCRKALRLVPPVICCHSSALPGSAVSFLPRVGLARAPLQAKQACYVLPTFRSSILPQYNRHADEAPNTDGS